MRPTAVAGRVDHQAKFEGIAADGDETTKTRLLRFSQSSVPH
jgi:hypothetical protein